MSDVAVLGLAVDSSAVTQATAALASFQVAAGKAAAASSTLQQQSASSAVDMAGLGKALSQAVGDLNVAAVAGDEHTESLRGQRAALRGLAGDLALLGPQFGNAATMASVLYVENAHLLENFSGLKSAIGALMTPTNLMIGGIVGLAAGTALALVSWKNFALQLDDTAHIAGATSTAMAQLQAAASFKGIGQDDFTKGIQSFSRELYDAKNNMGNLVEVLRANGVSAAGDFTTVFGKAADLIKNASSDQQRLVLLQQMGLPATMEWVRLMSSGAAGIKQAAEEAVAFGGAANDNMVAKAKEFDEAWNKAATNFGYTWRGLIVEVSGLFDRLSAQATRVLTQDNPDTNRLVGSRLLTAGQGTALGTNFDAFYKATGAGGAAPAASKTTVDKAVVQADIARAQPWLGLLGTTPSKTPKEKPKPEPVKEAA